MIYYPIIANAGVPMIFLQMPAMLIALIPVIIIELLIAKHLTRLDWKKVSLGVTTANIISTIIGIPLSWGIMLGLELLTTGGGVYTGPLEKVAAVTLQAAWLIPYENDLFWMIPTAMVVLLIPAFLISVWMERLVCFRFWKSIERVSVKRAVWIFNAISYGILMVCVFVWLSISIALEKSNSNQKLGPTVNTPGESGNEQGSAGHL